MEITGKCIKVLDATRFTSKKNGQEYVKYSFVVEYNEGQYPKRTVFTFMGEDKWRQFGLAEGGTYCVSFDIDAREYNGRWYNDLSAWKVVRIDQQSAVQAASPAPAQTPAPAGNGGVSDLPF